MKLLGEGRRYPSGERALHVAFEAGEPRPLLHKRPRKKDCTGDLGVRVVRLDEVKPYLAKRPTCATCKKRVHGATFVATLTVALESLPRYADIPARCACGHGHGRHVVLKGFREEPDVARCLDCEECHALQERFC